MAGNPALTEATYYILLSLVNPNHGYGIMLDTESMSGGRVRLAAGTLYGALSTLCERGWIVQVRTTDEGRKKEYVITEAGMNVLRTELERLRELVCNGDVVLKEN